MVGVFLQFVRVRVGVFFGHQIALESVEETPDLVIDCSLTFRVTAIKMEKG